MMNKNLTLTNPDYAIESMKRFLVLNREMELNRKTWRVKRGLKNTATISGEESHNNYNPQYFGTAFPEEKIKAASAAFLF